MAQGKNVLLEPFKTLNGAVPFDKIAVSDYEPAFNAGIEEHNKEISAICDNPATPTFENTIVALDRSGATLDRVMGVFEAVLEADANDEMMAISQRIIPVITQHTTSIILNDKLWQRVKYVYEHADQSALDTESKMLLNKTYTNFFNRGAALEGAKKERFKEISARLAELSLTYGQNCLKDQNLFKMWLNESDLAGLPESAVDAAKMAAKENGSQTDYLFTLDAPSYSAFLKYSERRDLRQKIWTAYNTLNSAGEFDNSKNISEIVNLRLEYANLLGSKTFADYKLKETMAGSAETVNNFLAQLGKSYANAVTKEMKELGEYAKKITGDKSFAIMPWDYSFFANKLRVEKYSIDDEAMRPYFELNSVINGVFGLATKLYGITFAENHDAQVYHPEVVVYNVNRPDGSLLGMLYCDFFPRSTKRGGAWMTEFAGQRVDEKGVDHRPLVNIVMSFTKPTDTKPSLLTFYEVETFMHEFGHALHGLLSECHYSSLSGTSVYHDFVELPSQFNENFLTQKQFLDSFAKHYVTGESIPAELVSKIVASSQFAAAYACYRQLSYGMLDMAWHTIDKPFSGDIAEFENKAIKPVEIFAPVKGSALSPHFQHIFSGGYAAGYYGYKWAEVLDADAFSMFLENGIFDPKTAQSFLTNILQRGGSEHPMTLYKRFRGHEPDINALLIRDGIKK